MKKLVVLILFMFMASLASATPGPVTVGNTVWTLSSGQLIGTGTAMGDAQVHIALSDFGTVAGTVDPDPTTDGLLSDGVMFIAGNTGKVIDNDTYYQLLAGDIEGSDQALGVWYRFDINTVNLGTQTIDLYDDTFAYIGSIPEPMTMALLGFGGLFLRRRKR